MQDYTQFFFGALGFFLIDEKLYLVSQYNKKKIREIFHIFFQQIILYIYILNCDGFFLNTKS